MPPESRVGIVARALLLLGVAAAPLLAAAGVLNDYNAWDAAIPDAGEPARLDLALSGAPEGATITGVTVYYEIRHPYPGDLDVWLTAYYDGSWHDLYLYRQGDLGATDDIIERREGLHVWDGASPNQTWYLVVQDRVSGDTGMIDFFELWVTYSDGGSPAVAASLSTTPPAAAQPGETIRIAYRIRNEGDVARAFWVGGEIRRDDAPVADLGTRATSELMPGQSETNAFTYRVPADWQGRYTVRSIAWAGEPGRSDWLDADDATFPVGLPPLPALTGRVAYHTYSEYDDESPKDGFHSLDGIIQVVDLAGTTHCARAEQTIAGRVRHAMNPSFSSDGRRLVFMGLPAGGNYSHQDDRWTEALDLFLYDFAADVVVNLSEAAGLAGIEEDPSFSPDGTVVVFKADRRDLYALQLADYTLRPVTRDGLLSEESAPRYSPDGRWLVFWVGGGASSYIARTPAAGGAVEVVADHAPDITDYYPSYWDQNRIIYVSHDGRGGVDDDVRIKNYADGTDIPAAPGFNSSADDSDPFAVTDTLLGFSSRRLSTSAHWDLFYGDPLTGEAARFPFSTPSRHDLGGTYSGHPVFFEPGADGDGDGLADADEVQRHHTSIFTADSDGDGLSDGEEVAAGTAPLDGRSFFALVAMEPLGPTLRWRSEGGRTYTVLRSTDPAAGFTPVATAIAATPGTNTYTDSGAVNGPVFYRVRTP